MNHNEAMVAIKARAPFKASNFSGEPVGRGLRSFGEGRLPWRMADHMRSVWAAGEMDYVVYSYSTPIAWHGIDGWHVPAIKYSVTTSKHQNYVRRAVGA